jgi:DNA excision repair protein ERCC-2
LRTVNEITPYERDIEKFFSGTKSISSRSYLLGKIRTCPFYQEGDDQSSRLCRVCLGIQPPLPQSQTSLTSRRMKSDPQLVSSKISAGYKMADLQREFVVPPAGDDEGVCLYHSLRGTSSRVTIMTYPYLLSKHVREGLKRMDLPSSLLILDEAHNVENAATDLFEFRLSCERIEKMKYALDQFSKVPIPLFHDEQFGEKVRGSLARLYEEVGTEAGEDAGDGAPKTRLRDRVAFLERIRKVPLEEIAQASSAVQDTRAVMLAEGAAGRAISDPFFPLLNFVGALEDEGLELFSQGKEELSLKLVDPAENLGALNEAKALFMMSGTMPGADYVSKVWGLTREIEEIRVERDYAGDYYSVFPRDAKRFELVDSVTTRFGERAESTWERYAYIIDVAYSSSQKNVLVCVPSYSIAEKVSRYLSIPHVREWKMTGHEEVLRKLQEGREERKRYAVISVAHGKLAEGIEFIDEENGASLIDTVVIAGIPYPVPDEYNRRRAMSILKRLGMGEGDVYDDGSIVDVGRLKAMYFLMAPASMAVRQAIGRAIRTPQDRATIFLADSRFNEPFWREELLGQTPA